MRKTLSQAILAAFCAILCVTSSLGGGGMNRRRILASLGAHTPTAKDYVQDGLIAMWDGIENAGWGVHDPNATVWKDLVGGKVINLSNRATWGDAFCQKLGSVGWFGYANINPINWVSCEICTRPIKGQKNTGVFLYNKQQFGCIVIMTSLRPCIYGVEKNYYRKTLDFYIENNTDYTIGFCTSNNNLVDGSCNGVKVDSTTTQSYGWPIGNVWGLGGSSDTDADFPYSGRIYCFRLYSRVISTAEAAANYAIDKARFGLT